MSLKLNLSAGFLFITLILAPIVDDLYLVILTSKWIDKSWVFFTCLLGLPLSQAPCPFRW